MRGKRHLKETRGEDKSDMMVAGRELVDVSACRTTRAYRDKEKGLVFLTTPHLVSVCDFAVLPRAAERI
jgi:hypothetical protein